MPLRRGQHAVDADAFLERLAGRPTRAKAVIVVPNSDISNKNGPIEWLASR